MNAILADKVNQQIAATLFQNSVCLRCILRVLKLESLELYRDKSKMVDMVGTLSDSIKAQQSLLAKYNVTKLIKVGGNQICVLCVGLLQECDLESHIQMIGEAIRKEKFEFERFKFLIKAPNSLTLRYAQMVHFLKQHLNSLGEGYETSLLNGWENKHIEVKTALKWIMAPLLSNYLGSHSTIEDDALEVILKFDNPEDEESCFAKFSETLKAMAEDKLNKKLERVQKRMKTQKLDNLKDKIERVEPSIANINRILSMDQQFFFKSILKGQFCSPVSGKCSFGVEIRCASVYLFGNYVKYSRYLSQTPWVVSGKRLTDSSIQEELQKVLLKYFYPEELRNSNQVKFHSGGREDIDVRMLSTGRPFALEFCSPRTTDIINQEGALQKIEQEINMNKYLRVNSLRFTDSQCLVTLKKSQIQKIKAYACFVHFQKPYTMEDVERLNSVEELVLNQRTPLRVLHRRTLMIRKKIIHRLYASPIDSQNMILSVLSSAGTYIKEFVHGDLQRTHPNVNSLTGNQADIFQLDVLKLYEKLDSEAVEDFLKVAIKIESQP